MSLELDWLEREERYRRRVVRLMWIFLLLVGSLLIWSIVAHSRAEKRTAKQAAAAAEAARLAEEKRVRQAFSSDSLAAATRLTRFMDKYKVGSVENTPLLQVPLPVGVPARSFVGQVWSDYAHVLDPAMSAEDASVRYREYYVDVMNDGPLRPKAILLPPIKQDKLNLVLDKVSFAAITRGQVAVGWREPIPEPVDSLAAATAGQAGTVPAAGDSARAVSPQAATPPAPVPAEPVPQEPAPATPPVAPPPATPPAVAPPSSTLTPPAPPDTTRKP